MQKDPDNAMASPESFEVITFDCYGTLIDWENGIRTCFKKALRDLGLSQRDEAEIFDLYEEEEKKLEAQAYMPYRRVLGEALDSAARLIGKKIPDQSKETLAEQLPNWVPFPDTNPALRRLARKYKLGILSNVDDDLLSGTLKHLTVPFEILVTAEKVRSYKPAPKHWVEARRMIGDRGWLHVAGSLYHDIEPASKLGVNAAWVNRNRHDRGRKHSAISVKEFRDLTELADWLAP